MRTPTSTSCSQMSCPRLPGIAEAADVFLERGSFDAAQSRRYLQACGATGLALRLHGDQFTESGAIELAIELDARSVDHLEATGPAGVAALAASGGVTGVLLPASALFLGRSMPPARPLAKRAALIALATDFNPGERVLRQPSARPVPCLYAIAPRARGGARCGHGERCACAQPRRPDRSGGDLGFAADIVLLDASDWRHVAYHLGGDIVHTVIERGAVVFRRTAYFT